jgi:histidinol-phosphate aminotransferase
MNGTEGGFSRRDFARLLGVGVGAAGLRPVAALAAATPAAAPAAAAREGIRDVIRLNANENPLGPCPGAMAAMREALATACRYPFGSEEALAEQIAALHGVSSEEVLLGNGSSEILELSVAAFCSAANPLVVAEPTFEAVLLHANAVGDKALLVPLTNDYRHDLPKMLAAAPAAGLIYLCNPNNPTATLTPKAEVRAFIAQVPRRTMVVVDEAYCHYADSADFESVIPLAREHPNLIVTRTFSKVYGMAGVRCGYAIAAPAAIASMQRHQAFNDLNSLGIAGARESLKDAAHVAHGRSVNRAVRDAAIADLAALGYRTLPSQANFFMVDLRRPAAPVIQAMREQGVAVGRPFQAVPSFLRVTVGTADQMRAFGAAFRRVMT